MRARSVKTITIPTDGGSGMTNQERLRQKLKAKTLAKLLADVYDVKQTADANGEALKQVIENALDKVRRSLEQDENQVS